MQSSWRTCVLNTPPPVSQSFSISARARSCFAPLLRSWAYTRMLVSTKHLSLMQFAARTGSRPAQIQPYAEPRHSPPSSAIISLTFSHEFRVQHNSTCRVLRRQLLYRSSLTFALQRGLWLAHPCAGTFTPTDSTRSRDFNAALLLDVAPDLDEVERGFRRKNVAPCHSGLAFRSVR